MNRWTWEETLLLKELYGTMTVAQLREQHFPHKTEASITSKVRDLRKRGWTFDTIRRLRRGDS